LREIADLRGDRIRVKLSNPRYSRRGQIQRDMCDLKLGRSDPMDL